MRRKDMLKKISWIVALFAALTIVFMGCTNLGVDPDAEPEDVERIDLGAPGFNTVAGQPNMQKGWATDGYTDVDNPEAAAEGYKLADFKKAKYLVIETANNARGGMQFVWQSPNFPDDNWTKQKFDALASSSAANPGVTKESNKLGGQTIKIDLKKVMGSTYSNFLDATGNVRFIIAYYSPNLADLDVKEAYLLVSAEAQEAGTELAGLGDGYAQLGQTTVRKSANEYGWQFAVKDSKLNVPKGFKDVEELRDAKYLVLVSQGAGIGVNGELAAYEELSITFEATGKYVDTLRATTSLWGPTLEYAHGSEEVFFVIDLTDVPGWSTIVQEQKFGTNDQAVKDGKAKVNDIKYYVVNLTLKYASALPNFGITKAYIFEDETTLNTALAKPATGADDLESVFMGQTITTSGYITKTNILLAILWESPVLFNLSDDDDIVAGTGNPSTPGTAAYAGTGDGFIVNTTKITAIKDAKAGSFLRAKIKNNSSGGRSGWGIGVVGAAGLNGPGGFAAGSSAYVDFEPSAIKGANAWGANIYINIYNDCAFEGFELYVLK
jgi:hypothetical protein